LGLPLPPFSYPRAGLRYLGYLIGALILLEIVVNYLVLPYSNTSGQWSYRDPKGRFSVDYPYGWREVKPSEDKGIIQFDSRVFGFKSDPSYSIVIGLGPVHEWQNGTLKELYDQYVTNGINTDPNFQVIKLADYTNYKIDGQKAVSWTNSASTDGEIFDKLIVASIFNGTSFYAELISKPDSLDVVVPLFSQTVASLNVTRVL
jgi:hypothetical protein